MIIKCPHCNSNYEIEKKLLSQKGRKVKCFTCSNYWIQHVDGKVVKLKLEDSFSTEINRRENLVKNSLNKSKLISKETDKKDSILSSQQEKELLSSLAISEIEKNLNSKNNLSYTNSNSMNRVENIRGKLKNNVEPHIIKSKRGLNKSYLGFIIISIFFICVYIFYKKPEFFIGQNTIYKEELLMFRDYIDFFVTNLSQIIQKQLMK